MKKIFTSTLREKNSTMKIL